MSIRASMIASACGVLIAVLGPPLIVHAKDGTAALPVTYLEEAKITIDERARADGYMRVRVQPKGGETREASIAIPRRMSENDIAKAIARALEPALAPLYKVDRDAGEHVKIKKAERGSPDFSIEIAFSAPGFAIILDK
jgi:hypothetical protein